jgi:vacuolar-type H+-ATPase subunit D/Vma8
MENEFLGLETTFRELETIIGKLNENAVRDRKFDLSVMTHDELKKILESKTGRREKRRILLTQIGFLRINIFNECYKKIQLAETKRELDEAVKIMNDYVEHVAMQFIQERLHPSLTDRIINSFSKSKIPDAVKTIEEWKSSLSTWTEDKSTPLDQEKKIKVYTKIKEIFITLDMLSFSFDNFPPLATDPAH